MSVNKNWYRRNSQKTQNWAELPLCNKRTPGRKETSTNQKKVDNSGAQIKNLKVLYTNCDTVSNKFEELEIAVKIKNPSAIIRTEVAPKNARYKLQKFFFINDLTKKHNSSGIAIYVYKCVSASQIHMRSIASDTVWVEIMVENNKNCIGRGVQKSQQHSIKLLKKLQKGTKTNCWIEILTVKT